MPETIKKMDKSEVDKKLAKHIILNNISFNVVQTQSFINFVKSVAEFGSTYKLPSYSTLRTKLIPDSRTEVEAYIGNMKKNWVATGCTLMSDIWSDMKQRAFINIIAYSPGGAVFMNSFEISKDKKTGVYLKDIMSSVIEDIGHNHVVQFITDNASNFESAGDMLIGKYPRMYKTRCAVHGIQLLLKDIYSEVLWIHDIIDDAKLIVTYLYKHTIILSLMREHTNHKELKHPCAARFASNFLMVQSILEVEDGLRLLVASSEWRGLDYNKRGMGLKVASIIQSVEFWSKGKEVIQTLEPLVRVLRFVDGDGSTAGYLYEAMERAKETIKQRCCINQANYMQIWVLFEKRRIENVIHPIHAAAAFLNPTFMCSEDFRENREMKDGIDFMLGNFIIEEEKEDFIRELQFYRMKITTLFTNTAKTMLKTSHPRVWWDYCGNCLPVLQKYAIRILSQPCSSSSCERNWSAWEAAQTKKRNRLAPTMLDNLVYVRMDTMMMEKFKTLEAQDFEPINLDKLSDNLKYIDHEELEDYSLEPTDNVSSDIVTNNEDLSWLDGVI
ncbi:uncharacterized protein LOC132281076 [Cornus florida]|uniref:uncharacterized protein LOC132281076 n=1 Tax=Cornus florida TaxID=4283 RepID=UPI00289E76ED|nr:uncharacterized protein LOC132281076 [Cornus florida]